MPLDSSDIPIVCRATAAREGAYRRCVILLGNAPAFRPFLVGHVSSALPDITNTPTAFVSSFPTPTPKDNIALNDSILMTVHWNEIFSACNCENPGSIGVSCDDEGKCQCKPNFDGSKCEKCGDGYYNYPLCEGKGPSPLVVPFPSNEKE